MTALRVLDAIAAQRIDPRDHQGTAVDRWIHRHIPERCWWVRVVEGMKALER